MDPFISEPFAQGMLSGDSPVAPARVAVALFISLAPLRREQTAFNKMRKPITKLPERFTAVTDPDDRYRASLDKSRTYNTDLAFWKRVREGYLTWPDGGPTLLVLEGEIHAIPREGWLARFEDHDQAEKILLAAGFHRTEQLFRFRA